ncbi:hypothetical protein LBMAG47_07840 [Planctomycetia bacterium]|nr:hypothetical protein LBMAG47_07840 [Planctomycetia bacterium]
MVATSTASVGIPCHGADGPREERFKAGTYIEKNSTYAVDSSQLLRRSLESGHSIGEIFRVLTGRRQRAP